MIGNGLKTMSVRKSVVLRRAWNFACFFIRNLALYKREVYTMEMENGNHLYRKGLIFNCVSI
jgi:hypothetical protein